MTDLAIPIATAAACYLPSCNSERFCVSLRRILESSLNLNFTRISPCSETTTLTGAYAGVRKSEGAQSLFVLFLNPDFCTLKFTQSMEQQHWVNNSTPNKVKVLSVKVLQSATVKSVTVLKLSTTFYVLGIQES